MTREEARKHMMLWVYSLDDMLPKQVMEALTMAADALRPVSREQAEKIRGEWVQNRNAIIDSIMCSKCGAIYQAYYGGYPYCPRCGAPMTDEAVQMVMERLEDMLSKE